MGDLPLAVRLKSLLKKPAIECNSRGKHPAVAEGHVDSIAFTARLKSCPPKKQEFGRVGIWANSKKGATDIGINSAS
jgi:hypothetical protein